MVFIACEKDSDNTANTPNAPSFKGKWMLISHYNYHTIEDSTTDLYALKKSCEKDNIIEFKGNRQLLELSEKIKCYTGEPEIVKSGTWEYSKFYNELDFDLSYNEHHFYDVVTLSTETLRLQTGSYAYFEERVYIRP